MKKMKKKDFIFLPPESLTVSGGILSPELFSKCRLIALRGAVW